MSIFDIKVKTIDGTDTSLEAYRGKIMLIVNVASHCGFTPQYRGLEKLYRAHKADGLVVLAFPCNQFGFQEPRGNEKISAFCKSKYDVTFPVFSKIKVNGPKAHPLYRLLKSAQAGALGTERIKWNFTKFLVDKDGSVVRRYAPITRPDTIASDVEALLDPLALKPANQLNRHGASLMAEPIGDTP